VQPSKAAIATRGVRSRPKLRAADGWYRDILESSPERLGIHVCADRFACDPCRAGSDPVSANELAKKQDRGPPLEIALVNAKSIAKPMKADILAVESRGWRQYRCRPACQDTAAGLAERAAEFGNCRRNPAWKSWNDRPRN
jgi:hypothetical protein